MAKKTAEKGEPKDVAKCDTLNEVTPNHDELITSVAQSSPESVSIKAMIRLIRGQQVMLDSDLAFLYGVETRRLNEQVKRNIERFPSDFMFQLTKEEFDFLKSQFAMSNITDSQDNKNLKSQFAISKWGGTRKHPYAFTRNGVAILSSVLRSQTAVGVNVKIMRVFTAIPQLVNNNAQMIQRIFNIEQHQLETDEKINVLYSNYAEFQKSHLDFLIQQDIIGVNPDGCLYIVNQSTIKVLRSLWEYGVCSYWHYNDEERQVLDEMVAKGWLVKDNHLLSKPERDYFSYYLDNRKFTNGMAYRNHYMHESTPPVDDEKEHQIAYITFLRLLAILLLKFG